ncbi:MAG: hypothetical protein QXK89_06170 [Candidatus Bathyarchaeia archaeon]
MSGSKPQKPKMTVTQDPNDLSITFKVDTSDGIYSVTYRPDGTQITQIPTPTGTKVIFTPGKRKGSRGK